MVILPTFLHTKLKLQATTMRAKTKAQESASAKALLRVYKSSHAVGTWIWML